MYKSNHMYYNNCLSFNGSNDHQSINHFLLLDMKRKTGEQIEPDERDSDVEQFS